MYINSILSILDDLLLYQKSTLHRNKQTQLLSFIMGLTDWQSFLSKRKIMFKPKIVATPVEFIKY